MSPLTANQVTKYYLYGKDAIPTDLVDNALIRPTLITPHVDVDAVTYMADTGRFALASMSELVKQFFAYTGDIPGVIPGVAYTKADIAGFLGIANYAINFQQYSYDDGKGDYGERIYVWGSTAYKISDDARFIMDADGKRHIENCAVIPRFDVTEKDNNLKENFDFKSDNLETAVSNGLLQAKIDPSGIGRTVIFDFNNTDNVPRASYGLSNFLSDVANEQSWYQGTLATNGVNVYNAVETVWQQLWNDGVTKFLDNGKPIIYGTLGNDTLSASSISSFSLISDYVSNGIVLVGGSGNDSLTGGDFSDKLLGGIGNDSLDGGVGIDTMIGGTGKDTYIVDNTGDVVTENAGEGIDTVNSSVTYTLGANIENLTLTGTAAINGTGNVLNNVLTGNAKANALTGGAGNDTLDGGAGNDVLNGGIGIDKMTGGTGNDIYVVDNSGDVVTENSTLITEIDSVNSSIDYTLGANLEKLTLTGTAAINGIGNELNNTLTGNSATNTLTGGLGDDTYLIGIGDVVSENVGEGNDTVKINDNLITSVDFTNVSVENLEIANTRTAPLKVKVNDLVNFTLSNNATNPDDISFNFNKLQTAQVVINTGVGSDTIHITSPIIGSGHHLNFADLSATDKIDLSAFLTKGHVVTQTATIPEGTVGYYLMAPSSTIHIGGTALPDFVNISANWELRSLAADPSSPLYFTKIDFIGNFAESNFQIA
jgi:hypothetical protein